MLGSPEFQTAIIAAQMEKMPGWINIRFTLISRATSLPEGASGKFVLIEKYWPWINQVY